MMRSRKKEEREKKVRKEPKTRRKSKKNVSKDEKESEKRGRHPACARRPFDMTRLDVRELVRAARKQKESSDGGEAAARRKREERAMIIDRATRAAAAIAERASTSESDPLKKVALATDVLEGVCYWPDFVSEEEEASLVAAVDLVSEGRWIGGEESDDRFAAAAAATATAAAAQAAHADPQSRDPIARGPCRKLRGCEVRHLRPHRQDRSGSPWDRRRWDPVRDRRRWDLVVRSV